MSKISNALLAAFLATFSIFSGSCHKAPCPPIQQPPVAEQKEVQRVKPLEEILFSYSSEYVPLKLEPIEGLAICMPKDGELEMFYTNWEKHLVNATLKKNREIIERIVDNGLFFPDRPSYRLASVQSGDSVYIGAIEHKGDRYYANIYQKKGGDFKKIGVLEQYAEQLAFLKQGDKTSLLDYSDDSIKVREISKNGELSQVKEEFKVGKIDGQFLAMDDNGKIAIAYSDGKDLRVDYKSKEGWSKGKLLGNYAPADAKINDGKTYILGYDAQKNLVLIEMNENGEINKPKIICTYENHPSNPTLQILGKNIEINYIQNEERGRHQPRNGRLETVVYTANGCVRHEPNKVVSLLDYSSSDSIKTGKSESINVTTANGGVYILKIKSSEKK
jgi:hypothetical protein